MGDGTVSGKPLKAITAHVALHVKEGTPNTPHLLMAFFNTSAFFQHSYPSVRPGGRIIHDPYQPLRTLRNWRQVQACARNGYNLVSCFSEVRDPRDLTYGHYVSRLPVNGNGVPFSAKRSLLASRLRRGVYTDDGIWVSFKEHSRCGPSPDIIMDRPVVNHNRVKAIDRLRGCLLGVEIEYYPTDPDAMPDAFVDGPLCRMGTDGSIGSGGREIRKLTWANSSGRLAGLLGIPLVGTTDERCGLHVHVDCRHLGNGSLLSVVPTYERVLQFYPHLKRLVPRNRLNNKFCYWENNCPRSAGFTRDGRYCAVNFLAWDEHKTLEFRMQGGMTNPVAIESWALLCQFIVNWAAIADNAIPQTFSQFVAILREPLRSWAILRDRAIKSFLRIDPRVLSAIHTS